MVILSYNRPHNLEKSLPILNKYKHIDEILVFHGHPDYYKEFKYDKVKNYKDYKLNEKYGCARRWFHVNRVKNDNILFLDDDLLPSENFINNAYTEINNNNNTIYGSKMFMRICDIDGYRTTRNDNIYNTILTGCTLIHKNIISELKELGVKIKLITDGDVLGALYVSNPKYNVDIFLGIGGGPEGVLAASALDAFDCHFQCRFIFDNEKDIKDAKEMGISDFNKKYELNEIIKGDSIFCLTGITSGEMLDGVEINENKYITETLVTHKSLKFKKIIKRTNLIEE